MPTGSLEKDPAFLQAIAAGDEQSFALLFDWYSPKVLQVAFQFTHSQDQARDILQDVFMRLWLRRADIPGVRNLEGWIFVITRNFSLTMLAKNARMALTGESYPDYLPALEAGAESRLEASQLEGLLREAIKTLPLQQQRVFELSKLQHQSREEVARELGISPNTVKSHLFQATRTVRAYLLSKLDYLVLYILLYLFF